VRLSSPASTTIRLFLIMGMSSIPTSVSWAASNDVNPSIGRVIRLTALWSYSIEFITIRSLSARG
jgi:hypothetical protein